MNVKFNEREIVTKYNQQKAKNRNLSRRNKKLTAQLATANERIGELETNISEGNLLMQRFTDGDILYSRDEIPLTMQGLGRKLNAEQQRITDLVARLALSEAVNKELGHTAYTLTAERDTLRAALRPRDVDNLNPDELADVERFRNAMLAKLNTTTQVRCFKGMEDRGGTTWLERQTWVGSSTNFIRKLLKEVAELRAAKSNDEVAAEAVDVANFAMMIYAQAAALCDGDKEDDNEKETG